MARGGRLEKSVNLASIAPAHAERAEEIVHPLGHGRSLALVAPPRAEATEATETIEAIEIRAESGKLELRIRITDAGPVLEMEGLRLAVTAAESIEFKSRRVVVEAEESLTMASRGQAQILAHDTIHVRTREYLGLDGKLVGLRSDEQAIVRDIAERDFGGDIEKCLQWLAAQAPAVDW
jgi:hypothetical protein